MIDLSGARIAVAGGGALGACIAVHLAHCGAQILLADPAALGDNASGVAAGMLAPALEAALDPAGAGRFELMREARDLWPGFLKAVGDLDNTIERGGALWLGDEALAPGRLAGLRALGAGAELVTEAQARRMSPGLRVRGDCVFTPEDWRVEPLGLLTSLRAALLRMDGRVEARAVRSAAPGRVVLEGGEVWGADWTVFAGGHPDAAALALAPELRRLAPIKGQILRFDRGVAPGGGPIVRVDDVYVAPSRRGAAAGATMEPGKADRVAEPEIAEALRRSAAALFPALASAQAQAMAGVRSTAPDGLPLVGRSAAPGVILAVGARRNGWLLGPLIAQMVRDLVAGGDGGALAATFHPARAFSAR